MKLTDLHLNEGQLEGLPANPRYIDARDFEQLKMRILKMPQYLRHNQLKVEEHNIILGGNMRYRALQALAEEHAVARWTDKAGAEHSHIFTDEIPDEWVAHLQDYTIEQKRHIVLLDNAQNGKDDYERLANEWDMSEINDWGNAIPDEWFNSQEQDEEDALQVEDDHFDENEEYIETRCAAGDIWQLGDHRLICGDSCSKNTITRLLAGEQVSLWLTDPPYNVNVSNSQNMKIKNDNMDNQSFGKFLREAFAAAETGLAAGASFYVWFAGKEHINFETALNSVGLYVRQELIWNKNAFILGRQDYQWKHEPCLYGWKEGAAHYFVNNRSLATVFSDTMPTEKDLEKMKKEDMLALLKHIYQLPTSVIDCKKPTKNTDHPTMKPLELFGQLMKNSSRMGDRVLDTFGGSGTTLICAEQLKRKCYMVELDPHYCDVILARWEKLTEKKATKKD